MPAYLTVAQLAKAWEVSESRIKQWIAGKRLRTASGGLGAVKHGRDWVVLSTVLRPAAGVPGRPRKKKGPEVTPEAPGSGRRFSPARS